MWGREDGGAGRHEVTLESDHLVRQREAMLSQNSVLTAFFISLRTAGGSDDFANSTDWIGADLSG